MELLSGLLSRVFTSETLCQSRVVRTSLLPEETGHTSTRNMRVQAVEDSTGNTMKLYIQEKSPHYFSATRFNHEMIETMPDYPLRDDDIILCSYTKTGCHWFWEILRQMVSGIAVTGSDEKETCMMEFHKYIQDLDQLPSPRILNNHQFFELQPKDLLRKNVKVAFIYRNPKDVVVSYYHHVKRLNEYYEFTGDFKSFLIRFAEGFLDNNSMFEYLKGWENGIKENPDMNIYIVSYEDLQAEPLPHLRRLAKFLGKEYEDAFLESVVKSTSFDAMKKQKGDVISDSNGSIMYRKGKVGDWKNYFTVAQSLWFDHIIRTRMGTSTMFPFKYSI